MDPVEESSLRAAGARIGEFNRTDWVASVSQHTMADLIWAVAATKLRLGRYVVPTDLTEALRQRAKRPDGIRVAVAEKPLALPDARAEITDATAVADHLLKVTETISEPPASDTYTAKMRQRSRPYIDAIAKVGKGTLEEIALACGRHASFVQSWLHGHKDLVERLVEYRKGMSHTVIRLSPAGIALAKSLCVGVTPSPATTTEGPEDGTLATTMPQACDPAPEPPPAAPAPPSPSNSLETAPAGRTAFDVRGNTVVVQPPPYPIETFGQVFPNPEPVKPPIPAENSLEIGPLVAELSTKPGTLEHDLAALLRKHVTCHGYAVTMKSLAACRYLLGLGQ